MEASRKNHRIFHSHMHHTQSYNVKFTQKQSLETIAVPYYRIEEQLQIYSWRKQHSNQVVSYNWIRLEPYSQFQAAFFLQPLYKLTNLKDIKTINGNRALSIISRIFMGFYCLYEKFGPFQLSQELIAFDIFLNPSVWLNKEFIKNQYTRDHISEAEFSSNILYILLKNEHKFQDHHLLDYCCGLQGQELSLKQLSIHFKEYHEKQSSFKKYKSPESTLSFNKKSRKKQMDNFKNKIKNLGRQNNQIYHSNLDLEQKPSKIMLRQSPSLKNFDPKISKNDEKLEQLQDQLKRSLSVSNNTDKQEIEQHHCLPCQEVLQVSLSFESQEHIQAPKAVIHLQKLDMLKRLLTTSINFND